MEQLVAIGLDLAKSVFQIHGLGEDDTVVLRRKLRRGQVLRPVCLALWAWKPAPVRLTEPAI